MHAALSAAAFSCALCALTACGDSNVDTLSPVSLPVPGNVRVEAAATALTVRWNAVEDAAGYVVRLQDAAGGQIERQVDLPEALFSQLEEHADFRVCVQAKGEGLHADSPFTEWIACRTLQGSVALAVPADVTVEATAESLRVSWSAVDGATQYVVRLKNAADQVTEERTAQNEWIFDTLQPETDYEIALCAAGGDEFHPDSPFTEWIACRTLEGDVARAFAGGTGTEDDPWLIATPGQLFLMAALVNEAQEQDTHYARDAYRLTADVDLAGRAWTPIGTGIGNESLQAPEKNLFRGRFNGDGHTVSGLFVHTATEGQPALAGLFGILYGARVESLTVCGNVEALCATPNTEVYAGGIGAIVSVQSVLTDCRFEGSVRARSDAGALVLAAAGGICGTAQAAALDGCSVKIDASSEVSAEGLQALAGGICGNGNSGRLQGAVVAIDGRVEALVGEGTSEGNLALAAAGGAVGNNFGLVVSDAYVSVAGKVAAAGNGFRGSSVAAGGLAGSNAADAVGGVEIDLKGEIVATDGETVCAAGGIASQQNAGYGVSGISVRTGEGSRIAGLTEVSAAYVGGVQGRVSYQNPATTGACSADLAGKLEAEAPEFAIAGGVGGSTVGMNRCRAIFRESAEVRVVSPANAAFGGVLGNASSGNVYACYAILDGVVKVGGEGVAAIAGGVSGVWLGNRMSKRYMSGCYAIVRGTIATEGSVSSSLFGGIAGNKTSPYGYVNSCFWWCDNNSVTGIFGNGDEQTGRLAGLAETDWTAAAEEMNAAIADYGTYRYDASAGWLVLDPPAER